MKFVRLHLGNAEIISLKKQIDSAKSWEYSEVWNIRSLQNAIFIPLFNCSFIFFPRILTELCLLGTFSESIWSP